MNARKQQNALLKAAGAILLRQRKHQVWRLPDGRRFVRASTPSDYRSGVNGLRELQKILNTEKEVRAA